MKKYNVHRNSIIESLKELDFYTEDNLSLLINKISYNPKKIDLKQYTQDSLLVSNDETLYLYSQDNHDLKFFILNNKVYVSAKEVKVYSKKHCDIHRELELSKEELHYEYRHSNKDEEYMEKLEGLLTKADKEVPFSLEDLDIVVNSYEYKNLSDVKLTEYGLFMTAGELAGHVSKNFLDETTYVQLSNLECISKSNALEQDFYEYYCYNSQIGIFENYYKPLNIAYLYSGRGCYAIQENKLITFNLLWDNKFDSREDMLEFLKNNNVSDSYFKRKKELDEIEDLFF